MKRKVRMRKMLREDDIEELIKQVQEQEPEGEKAGAAKAEKPAATPADKVLELQKSAGNSAVGAVLDRLAAPAGQRSRAVAHWPSAPQMALDGDEPVPIESVQDATQKRTARDADPNGPGEFVVHMLQGKHTVGLHHAVVEGRHCAKVEIVIPGKGGGRGMRWILYDVYLSVGSLSQDSQTVQLSYSRRELVFSPPVGR
jgi:hypothetical protein